MGFDLCLPTESAMLGNHAEMMIRGYGKACGFETVM